MNKMNLENFRQTYLKTISESDDLKNYIRSIVEEFISESTKTDGYFAIRDAFDDSSLFSGFLERDWEMLKRNFTSNKLESVNNILSSLKLKSEEDYYTIINGGGSEGVEDLFAILKRKPELRLVRKVFDKMFDIMYNE